MPKPRFMMRAKLYGASLYAAGLYSGVGVEVVASPTISIEVPLTVRRSLQRGLGVDWWASVSSMTVRTSTTIGLTVRTGIELDEMPAGAEE